MQKILLNNSEKSILRKFENEEENFQVIPDQDSNIKFWAIIKNSQISFEFNIQNENTNIECYFLIPAIKNQNIKLDINTNFKVSNSKVGINVIALASDNASITLNGKLHIENGIKGVETKLYEETLLLWNAKYISLIPWLRVDSPDVKACHWAKVQRISPERLFYMQSRGLDSEKAIWMIINSYSQQIIEKLWLNEQEQSEFYSMIK